MKISKIAFSVLAIAVVFAACQNVDFKKTKAGIPYKIFSSKSGDSVKPGSIVKYEVIQKLKDSVIFSSYEQGRPQYYQVQPSSAPLTYSNIRANVEDLIAQSKAGDSIYLVQATDSLLKEDAQTPFPKGERLITTVKIVDVYKDEAAANAAAIKDQALHYDENKAKGLESFKKDTASQAAIQKDDAAIEQYLNAHNIKAEKSPWGIYIERLAPGQGPKPKFGQYSNVHYKGMHMSGEVFDEGTMPVQIGISRVVFGFMEGVSQLSKGEKARIYIPSLLAYGPQGNPPKIKPNENLIFEVQVLDITDNDPSAAQTQPADSTK